MLNHYLAKQEQYKDLLREAEKERLIREIEKANQDRQQESDHISEWEKNSWIQKLNLILKDPRLMSSR